MISSTAWDLPDHRAMVADACLRLGVQPIMMEHLAAQDRSASNVSIGMVDDAAVYLGILAFAYGSSPEGDDRSYTEIELDRAENIGLKILVFFADESSPWPPLLVDKGEKAAKLERLKRIAAKNRILSKFRSPEDLRGLVLHALSDFIRASKYSDQEFEPHFHPPNNIPQAPKPYVAHPYVLLQTEDVIGRRYELDLLTDWITTNKHVPEHTSVFSIVAIGGMGKSALTWKWFEQIAPKEIPKLAGRMWWSFYESDAHWDNFIIRGLAYTTGSTEGEMRRLTPLQREDALLVRLSEDPFLLVLDGFERVLVAYARMDAARLSDDDLDEQSANTIASTTGDSVDTGDTQLEKHRLRQCADVRVGAFLRKLALVPGSRVLLSTRLYPAELETSAAKPHLESKILWNPGMPKCFAMRLGGLTDEDALSLWRSFISGDRSGSPDQLLPLFQAFDNYPLLLRALAGEVAQYRGAPGDFAIWRRDNPDFNPARLPLKNRKAHVLEFALRGLGKDQKRVLRTVAAFRMPATWETLRALLVSNSWFRRRIFSRDSQLGAVFIELEDRGLVGWDRASNRYDLHPVVRAVVWHTTPRLKRRTIHAALRRYFYGISNVNLRRDGYVAVHLYDSLSGLSRFDDAVRIYRDRISKESWDIVRPQTRIELLEQLFPDGLDKRSTLGDDELQTYVLMELADAYSKKGEPGRAILLLQRAIRSRSARYYGPVDIALAKALLQTGAICQAIQQSHPLFQVMTRGDAERSADRQSRARRWQYALVRAVMGDIAEATLIWKEEVSEASQQLKFRERYRIDSADQVVQWEASAYLRFMHAKTFINPEDVDCDFNWEAVERSAATEPALILVTRLRGIACFKGGDPTGAIDYLCDAIKRARAINLVEEELPALVALARIHLHLAVTASSEDERGRRYTTARELLEQVWSPASRGPYPLWHAEACNLLAQLERECGTQDAAIQAARTAYKLAWCDGSPYVYQSALSDARRHLFELGIPEPPYPAFDSSQFPPMRELHKLLSDDEYVSFRP